LVWTDSGKLFTFGRGNYENSNLGHGYKNEPVPRQVQALVGKTVVGAAAGGDHEHTSVWTEDGELFTFGLGNLGRLGHGGQEIEFVPRLVEALAGKKVVGATAGGSSHTAVWTDVGELFTFGYGQYEVSGVLGHGGGPEEIELMPRLVEALVGKQVVGAATGSQHTAVWTKAGELFTFGKGYDGQLGHGGHEDELVPRLVEALVGKKVIGAAIGAHHTAVWTDACELFTFGRGECGPLGHGGQANKFVPRLVEARLVGRNTHTRRTRQREKKFAPY
jgi:RCC1 and BTB domain-containing protein